MRPASARSLLVVALLLAGSVGGVVGQTTPTATATPDDATETSGVTIVVGLERSGDARWNVSIEFPIHSENDSDAFEQLAEEFERGDVGPDSELFERAASEAAGQTDREMAIQDVERSTHLGNATGVLSLSFTWTNFSRMTGDRLVVGDAFTSESGTWLPRLTDDQRLVVQPPTEFNVQSTNWGVTNQSLVIDGPATFEPGEPSAVYVGDASTPTRTPTPSGPFDGSSLPLLFVAVLSAAGVAGAYVWMRRQDADPEVSPEGERDDERALDVSPSMEATETDDDSGAVDEGGDEDEPDDEVDVELLSDEERVLRLLSENGGRMKQANIVRETRWSNAKVSQLLSGMAEEGRINKLRIGRENLISLPGEEPGEIE